MKAFDDRLSELPDSLILEILSLLPMRDVVKTTILSKRWRDFWTTIPCLDFKLPPKKKKGLLITLILFCLDLEEEEEKNGDEWNFINQVQRHWRGIRIRNFKISFNTKFDAPLSGDVIDSWLRFATEKKVQDLCLDLPFDWSKPLESPEYVLPQCMYSCSSMTKLWISGCNLRIQENVIKWDNLKTLSLQGSCFSEDVINQVVSSSPRLESLELRLRSSRHNMNIQSNSLKALTVVKYNAVDTHEYTMLTICAPKLESLHLLGNAYSECKLLMDGSSLTHATLCFYDKWYAVVEKTLVQILPAIKHVEAVTISPCSFKMLGVMQSVSPFWKVKRLKLYGGPVKPKEIVGLVKIFPKVEKLEINWKLDQWYPSFLGNLAKNSTYVESEARIPNKFMMQLRKVEFTGCSYLDLPALFPLIVFLRQHSTMLQQTMLEGVCLEEFDTKMKKLQKQLKHTFKWGLLGIGIAVTAYTFIKWRPSGTAETADLKDIGAPFFIFCSSST